MAEVVVDPGLRCVTKGRVRACWTPSRRGHLGQACRPSSGLWESLRLRCGTGSCSGRQHEGSWTDTHRKRAARAAQRRAEVTLVTCPRCAHGAEDGWWGPPLQLHPLPQVPPGLAHGLTPVPLHPLLRPLFGLPGRRPPHDGHWLSAAGRGAHQGRSASARALPGPPRPDLAFGGPEPVDDRHPQDPRRPAAFCGAAPNAPTSDSSAIAKRGGVMLPRTRAGVPWPPRGRLAWAWLSLLPPPAPADEPVR